MGKRKIKLAVGLLLFFMLAAWNIDWMQETGFTMSKPSLNQTKITLKVGAAKKLRLKNLSGHPKIRWTSSDKGIAAVTSKGRVKAIKPGNAVITAKVAKQNLRFTCRVTVEEEAGSMDHMEIQAGGQVFLVSLADNASAKALANMLPMTVEMNELNGNEKYYNLPDKLPSKPEQVKNIHAGDIMLYGEDCLVLFYEDFQTSYSYTRLGRIDQVSGLADALGKGNVKAELRLAD